MMLTRPQDYHPDAHGPNTFAGLMELYELNYMWLRRLAPDLGQLRGTITSSVRGALDLYLAVVEREKYTTTLCLTYKFDQHEGPHVAPDLMIRIYHDARVAEVMECNRDRIFAGHTPNQIPTQGTLRWKLAANRFLLKWLRYCVLQGHGFDLGLADYPPRLPVLA
jgi:uncharacterized protein